MRKLRNYCVCGSFMLLFIFIGLMLCNIPGFVAISALWEGMFDGPIEETDDLIMFYIMAAFAFLFAASFDSSIAHLTITGLKSLASSASRL